MWSENAQYSLCTCVTLSQDNFLKIKSKLKVHVLARHCGSKTQEMETDK